MASQRDRLPTWCGDEGWCPMVATAAVLGRKWHPVIIHRLLEAGPMGFGDLESSINGVSGKMLSESLSDLSEKGLIDRTVIETKPVRVEYSLTEHGRGLEAAVEELDRWGRTYLREAPVPEDSII